MSRNRPERQYWDATLITALIGRETDRFEVCEFLVRAAANGEIQVVTSTLTLAEVTGGRRAAGHPEVQAAIHTFFQQPWLVLANVDRRIGLRAQEIRIDHHRRNKSIAGNDSIHLATALEVPRIARMFSFDDDDLNVLNRQ